MTYRARPAALVLALVLACAACSSKAAGPGGHGASGSPQPGSGTASGSAKPGAGGSNGSASSTPGSGAGGSNTQSYPDGGGVGDMARAFLRQTPAKELRVEVDWVTGRDPARSALDHLRSVLLGVVDKPDGVIVEKGHEIAASRNTWSVPQIAQLERAQRRRHSSGITATMWIVYLNGSYSENDGTLGLSYEASAAAIFLDQINSATTALIREAEIEQAVIAHETGHLLALVNIGYHSKYDHEDAAHPHHSKYSNSVMFWQIEDTSIKSLVNGIPSEFDQYDKADLQQLRDGG